VREEVSRLERLEEVSMVEEIAELLGVNVNMLYHWRTEGRFSAYTPGKGQRYRVCREEVTRLLGCSEGAEGTHDAG
jgi:excisionase family DNA binding protein